MLSLSGASSRVIKAQADWQGFKVVALPMLQKNLSSLLSSPSDDNVLKVLRLFGKLNAAGLLKEDGPWRVALCKLVEERLNGWEPTPESVQYTHHLTESY